MAYLIDLQTISSPITYFWMAYELRAVFTFFKWLKDNEKNETHDM